GNWGAVIGGTLVAALAITFGLRQAVLPLVKKHTLRLVPQFQDAIADAHADLAAALAAANTATEQARRQLRERLNADIAAAKTEYKRY
ncbi:hypothetical protein, partial [Klebsiella pneumoniae]|uniref:hypothetical protein n=1 Tax=Klebsiella pneumoniae TaxID=573 RepID=UPI0022713158